MKSLMIRVTEKSLKEEQATHPVACSCSGGGSCGSCGNCGGNPCAPHR